MKSHFRTAMAWLHTWTGLPLGWLLYLIFLTGSLGYLDTEIDRWMNPQLLAQAPLASPSQQAATALARLQERAPDAARWFIVLPTDRNDPLVRILWTPQPASDGVAARGGSALLDPVSGQPLGTLHSYGGQFLYRLHYQLHYLPAPAAHWIVGLATLLMLVALITGVIIHKKIFIEFFTFRPGKGVRSWLDAHNLLSVSSLPFQLMITYSGLVFFAFTYMPLVVVAHYGLEPSGRQSFTSELFEAGDSYPRSGTAQALAPLAPMLAQAESRWGAGRVNGIDIRQPGDAGARVLLRPNQDSPLRGGEIMVFDGSDGRLLEIRPAAASTVKTIYDTLLGLHEGLYAGPWLRAMYLLSGLAGAGMIASGLVLWAEKRRLRAERASGRRHAGLRLVESLNVGTILGLPIAIAGYFWANRLLPETWPQRAAWEGHILFIVWGLCLLHAALRPSRRAWLEQAGAAACAYAAIPLLNIFTSPRHLPATWIDGDAVFAGFDLATLLVGAGFAALAWRIGRQPGLAGSLR